jgi:hypothetical protein
LRRLIAGETLLVAGAVLGAAVLSSLPPPSKALASVGGAKAHVGPGPVNETGTYSHAAPALVMVGHWGLSFQIAPPGQKPFTVLFVDKANG